MRARNVFIGECKFWHGSKKLDEAIGPAARLHDLAGHQGGDHLVHHEQERHGRHRPAREPT